MNKPFSADEIVRDHTVNVIRARDRVKRAPFNRGLQIFFGTVVALIILASIWQVPPLAIPVATIGICLWIITRYREAIGKAVLKLLKFLGWVVYAFFILGVIATFGMIIYKIVMWAWS